jgi:Flp pilus assembly protein TadB
VASGIAVLLFLVVAVVLTDPLLRLAVVAIALIRIGEMTWWVVQGRRRRRAEAEDLQAPLPPA